ncbi:MAG TPA: rod-binding protein [bacterium]|nr:rod-binding protein [bacterium]
MNYSIEPLGMMSPALQAADPGFSLAAMGKAFPAHPTASLANLGDFLSTPSLNHPGFSLQAAHHLNPLVGTPTYSSAELKKVSQNFESIFMRMMFKEMRDSVQKSDLFGDSHAMDLFQSMSDDRLSDTLSAAGGIGLGNMIYQQLEKATAPHQTSIE